MTNELIRAQLLYVLMKLEHMLLEEWHRLNKEACKQIGDRT